MNNYSQEYLFVGGSRNGQKIRIPDNQYNIKMPTASLGLSEIYLKEIDENKEEFIYVCKELE
ncbi:MAG: hypothetical protein Q7R95_06050 [bacterium]|nr:hypothetical protein [bacterium]